MTITFGTYGQTALSTMQALGRDYLHLNNTTRRLLSEARIYGVARSSASVMLSNTVSSDVTAVNDAILNANTMISRNQTADDALGEISGKLTEMRQLVQDVALGSLSNKKIAAKDDEYQELAAEVAALVEDTAYAGEPLLTGSDAMAWVDLSSATGLSLTDLPDDAMATISLGISAVGLASSKLDVETTRLGNLIENLQAHKDDLLGYQSGLPAAQEVLDVLGTVTMQMMGDVFLALIAQNNSTSAAVLKLVD